MQTENIQTGKSITTSYFEWQGHSIIYQASLVNGKEWVYVDEQLVSSKRNFWIRSKHTLLVAGQPLIIRVKVTATNPVHISLYYNDVCIDQDAISYKNLNVIVNMGGWFVCGLLSGLAAMFFMAN